MKTRKKMNPQKFQRIWTVILAILVVIAIIANVAMNLFSAVLDSYLGRGELAYHTVEGTEDWDTTYYTSDYSSLAEAKANSDTVSEQTTDEAIVLLKNNGVLPLAEGSSVAPFGYAYLNPAYSGTGAAATTDTEIVTPEQGLAAHFTLNEAAVEKMNSGTAVYPDAAEGTSALDSDTNSLQAMMDAGESAKIYNYPASTYEGIEDSVSGSVGIVFITRNGSEGIDKRTEAYEDGTPHYLALTQDEKDTIAFVKANCDSCVVVLNTSNPMELTPIMSGEYEADAILWVGTTGSRGFASLGKILCGEVNPSGRLVDIYASDFTQDPTYVNFGDYSYTNTQVRDTTTLTFIPGANQGVIQRRFVEYEEGIYVGYRYYETADVEDDSFVYGELDRMGGIVTAGAVAYPFGYGLSYTTFSQEILSLDASGDDIVVTVQVTNTGDVAGREVVQVYYTAPYTEYDRTNLVEKSATVLAGFDKTELLQPGDSETVTVTFSWDSMASYDMSHLNEDGTQGCYLLEAGDYQIEVKANSHDVLDSRTVTAASTIAYEGDTTHDGDLTAASNELDTLNAYMSSGVSTNLTRSDWTGTQPTEPVEGESVAPQVALDEYERFENFDYETDALLGNVEGSLVYSAEMPTSNQDNGLTLSDMRGLDYDDPQWDLLLDQIDWEGDKESIQTLLYNAAYQTATVVSIGKPATTDKDGAMGWSIDGASSWASANLIACTWNDELYYAFGAAIGQEALQAGLTGWYAPAMNIHRSPFSGRVYEYYSEDGLLSGKVAAAVVSGAADQGVVSYIKHFVLNDQETYRAVYISTWATEQAVREIYMKPFEVCVKEAVTTIKYIADEEGTVSEKTIRASTALMSSQNSIGGIMGFAQYNLLTNVLRGEWGFEGAVISDLYPCDEVRYRDMSIRAGTDMYMNQSDYFAEDYDSATARSVMRNALHNICYMIVNSNAMNGMAPGTTVEYEMSPWRVCLLAGDAVILAFVVLMIVVMVRRKKDAQEHPERYQEQKAKTR